ncbi:hypothetical protein [Primorskyibacter flagellatus]|uniref:hypothetical protein n=1 Tax=Primorskyibacter flagellatus TaxID=1387277 RepID=UPI003A953199
MGPVTRFLNDVVDELETLGLTGVSQRVHYRRNGDQAAQKYYFDVMTAKADGAFKYKMLPDYKSVLHQFEENPNTNTDAFNTKWVSTTGEREEYVFKYVGTAQTGRFAMLTDDYNLSTSSGYFEYSNRNIGTYNYRPSGDVPGHTAFDILPWVLWGNNEADANDWPRHERLQALLDSLGQPFYSSLTNLNAAIEASYNPDLPAPNRSAGSMGADVFIATAGQDFFIGRGGRDTVDFSLSDRAVSVSLIRSYEDGQGFDGWAKGDGFWNIENLVGSDFGDILIGNGKANLLEGGAGADILSGMGGNDTIDGGAGANTIFGNYGDDTIYVHNIQTEVDGGVGFDTIISTMWQLHTGYYATFANVEVFRLIDSGPLAETAEDIFGSNADEVLIGNQYDNRLSGAGGSDFLDGGFGNDDLEGGLGNDTYVFREGWGVDVVGEEGGWDRLRFPDTSLDDLRLVREIGVNSGHLSIYHSNGTDHVFVGNHFSAAAYRADRLIAKDGVLDLRAGLPFTGTDASDSLAGTDYASGDFIDAAGGDDGIYAGDGADTIIGGSGNDLLSGDGGDDIFIFTPGFGHDEIYEAGVYQGEVDSSGDTIRMNGFSIGAVSADVDSQGRMTISVTDAFGAVTDSIFIHSQTYNYGDGNLIEWISFDDGALMPLTEF